MKKLCCLTLLSVFTLFLLNCKPAATDKNKELDAEYLRIIGSAYIEEDKLVEAEETFLKLIDLSPKDASGHANLGLVYLKQNKYKEALQRINKAVKLAPENPDIRMILAKYYEMMNNRDMSIEELEKLITISPDFAKAYYTLAVMFNLPEDQNAIAKREKYLTTLIELKPGNIVPRIELIELALKGGKDAEARKLLEELSKLFPEFPQEATEFYNKTLEALFASKSSEALSSLMVFHNFMKVTTQYQTDLKELKGPEGSLIGLSIVTISDLNMVQLREEERIVDRIRFLDVTSNMALDFTLNDGSHISHIALGDYNGDGFEDIYFSSNSTPRLMRNHRGGYFEEATAQSGIAHKGKESSGIFADYDNDGHLDLYIVKEGGNILYKNTGSGTFQDFTKISGVGDSQPGNKPLFFDVEQDGDLDLLLIRPNFNILYRNNADGTFTPLSENMGLAAANAGSRDAIFADFDEDGDLDVFIVNSATSNTLFTNERHGRYKDITAASGLTSNKGSVAVALGDYNNDGFQDLFVVSADGHESALYRNKGDGTFERQSGSENWLNAARQLNAKDAAFVDFDNDGLLDIIMVGEPKVTGGKGVFLFHNEDGVKFSDVTSLLPLSIKSGRQVEISDFDKDGDMDIFVVSIDGSLQLLQNEGGNINHFLKLQLQGLIRGNNKNNHFGIGAKVEIRAGDLYQMKVVTSPQIHFGLGHRLKADVVRILWPNGVPQNLFFPGTDQELIESQVLKGSCAFLYTWNGKEFVFAKDMMWRSALGMPLGIMGSTTAWAPADASKEYLKIPGEIMKPNKGKYTIQITEELWESAYFDKIDLVVLDYPASHDMFVDERFIPPPYPEYELYPVAQKKSPVSAVDGRGNNLLSLILDKDDQYISNFKLDKYQGVTEIKDLILDLGESTNDDNLFLFLNGWLFPSDASINVAIGQAKGYEVIAPQLQVMNKRGQWQTVVPAMGFPMGKDKTMVIDLSGKFLTKDRRVRIRTNMEIYWDYIFFASKAATPPLVTTRLKPASAGLHFRGFSRSYRKGGDYGPHWFDYYDVSKEPKWRDLTGYYTKFGDVLPLLATTDNKLVVMNSGDELTLSFDAAQLPPLPSGWKRDFLIYSEGWIKDGDLNTAHGQTVDPLPFHGMSSYPFGLQESLPSGKEYQDYLKTYNTRKVTTDEFRRRLLGNHF